MGMAQLLQPWNHVRNCHPHFLFHVDFYRAWLFIGATTENPALPKWWCHWKNIAWSSVETINSIEIIVCMAWNRCSVSLCFCQNFKISWNAPVDSLQRPEPLHIQFRICDSTPQIFNGICFSVGSLEIKSWGKDYKPRIYGEL